MGAAENKAIARRFFEEVLNGKQPDLARELLAADYVNHFPGQPQPIRGFAAWKQVAVGFNTAFPDFECVIEDVIAEGDRVAVRLTERGTNQGPFLGMPPSNKHAVWTPIDILRIRDGKIAEHWVEFDTMGLMQQIGALPSPETNRI